MDDKKYTDLLKIGAFVITMAVILAMMNSAR